MSYEWGGSAMSRLPILLIQVLYAVQVVLHEHRRVSIVNLLVNEG
jgi:hypothetical protein